MKRLFYALFFCFLCFPSFLYAAEPTTQNEWVSLAREQLSGMVEATKEALPHVTEAALNVAWASCLVIILSGVGALLGLTVFILLSYLLAKQQTLSDKYDFPVFGILSVASGMVSISFFIGMCLNLFSFWAWIGLFYPDLYLIHQLIEKIN